jgi:Bleomycin resistance protein-like N-terminal
MADLKYEIGSNDARADSVARVDMKLEVVVIPVADVDRAKKFYGKLGWRLVATYPRTSERRSQCNRQL